MIFMQPIANKMFRVDGGVIFLHIDQEFPVKILAQNFVFDRTKFVQNFVVLLSKRDIVTIWRMHLTENFETSSSFSSSFSNLKLSSIRVMLASAGDTFGCKWAGVKWVSYSGVTQF